jgi:hypothetical protein
MTRFVAGQDQIQLICIGIVLATMWLQCILATRRSTKVVHSEAFNDTLMAEAGSYASIIERFRDGKAEHNEASLAQVLGLGDEEKVRAEIRPLVDIGFLEEIKGSYKIPSLYREGLQITQGKAFTDSTEQENELEDEDD